MVMGAVRALCQFSIVVSQQNHSDLSLKALDDALKRFYQKEGIFWGKKISKSVKAKVNDLLATECFQWCEQKIHKIPAAMVALMNGTEKVSSTKGR